jgi:hypothetical protein
MTRHHLQATRALVLALFVATILAGCGTSTPLRDVYVLGGERPVRQAEVSQLGQPVIEITLARLPDYLDTTEMLRHGADGRVLASQSGRWGEWLSVGVTRAVALSLAARLPDFVITTSPPENVPWRKVPIDVDSFDARPDGTCILAAQWSIRPGDAGDVVDQQRTALVMDFVGSSDAALVATMSREVDMLAGRIAGSLLERSPASTIKGGSASTAARSDVGL